MASKALDLSRLTTEYVVEEDRICLSGESEAGEKALVWLTARMLGVLIPRLVAWLEGQTAGQPMADLRQTMAQEAAMSSHTAQAPVAPASSTSAFLTRSIDIVTAEDAMRLVFKEQETGDAQMVQVPFLATELRQWLGIIMAAYETAGWPLDVWPEWMQETKRVQSQPVRVNLH